MKTKQYKNKQSVVYIKSCEAEAVEFKSAVIIVVRYAIWYHLYTLKNVKNTHGGVLICKVADF